MMKSVLLLLLCSSILLVSADFTPQVTFYQSSPAGQAIYDMPRSDLSAVISNQDTLYVVAGKGGTLTHYSDNVWSSQNYGATWNKTATGTRFSPRAFTGAAITPAGTLLVTGGLNNGGAQSDVWQAVSASNTNWVQRATNAFPARYGHDIVIDPNFGTAIVMNGYGNNAKPLNDVWFSVNSDYSQWQSFGTMASAPRAYAAATIFAVPVQRPDGSWVQSSSQSYVFMMGGVTSDGSVLNDIWYGESIQATNNVTTTQLAVNAPWPARQRASLSADSRGNLYLFGGEDAAMNFFNDLWFMRFSSNMADYSTQWVQLTAGGCSSWPWNAQRFSQAVLGRYNQLIIMPNQGIIPAGGVSQKDLTKIIFIQTDATSVIPAMATKDLTLVQNTGCGPHDTGSFRTTAIISILVAGVPVFVIFFLVLSLARAARAEMVASGKDPLMEPLNNAQ